MAIIGIDATALSDVTCGGIGTSQYQTMKALAELDPSHRFFLYSVSPPVIPFSGLPLDVPWPVRLGSGRFTRRNIVWLQTGLDRLLEEDRVEIFWGPRQVLPFRARGVTKVATIHDFWHRWYPEHMPWKYRTIDRVLISSTVARADLVVSPSAATARDAISFCGLAADRICVVPWGVDQTVFRPLPHAQTETALARLGIRCPYVLSLDVYNPRKNFFMVLEGVAHLPEALRTSLTVVGLGKPRLNAVVADIRGRADVLGLSRQLRLLGDVQPEDLIALYSRAAALVYPSLHEGYGMPLLEAMACGCPVVTANTSSLPEVAGSAALLVDPTDSVEISEAIARAATDPAECARLVKAGLERVNEFTWQTTAEGMLHAFEQAIAVGKRGLTRARSR